MNDSEHAELLKKGLRRKLDPTEEAQLKEYFAAHPETQADWEAEAGLNLALRGLRDAPVSSNFTSQVLRLVERERNPTPSPRPSGPRSWLAAWNWGPKIALTAVVFGVGLVSYQQHRLSYREEVARGAGTVSSFASLPTLEMLENFDAIKRLDQVPSQVDKELLAALQ